VKRLSLVVPLVVCSALAAGCSGDDPEPTGSSASESASGSDSPSSEVIVENGVELTPQGSELAVGDTASVAYEPRQGLVGVLDIKVTRLEKTTFKKSFVGWDLNAQDRKKSPYFVRATVTNRGATQLGGRPAPLYVVDGTNALLEATPFASEFTPCSPRVFPEKFGPGKTVKVCLVYLAPNGGDLVAVSFRPTQDYDPITWTGELKSPRPPKKDKPGKGKGKGDKGDKGDGGNGGNG
jgi:hypothetical protein